MGRMGGCGALVRRDDRCVLAVVGGVARWRCAFVRDFGLELSGPRGRIRRPGGTAVCEFLVVYGAAHRHSGPQFRTGVERRRGFGGVSNTRLSPGYFQGSLYQGPVSAAYGSLALSPELSSQIFAGPAVLLVLRDTGGDVTLGLSPYSLLQSVQVSLSGDGFSVGGTVAAVSLKWADSLDGAADPQPFLVTDGLGAGDPAGDPSGVPEPQSGALLALGGVLLCLMAHFLKRSRRRGF